MGEQSFTWGNVLILAGWIFGFIIGVSQLYVANKMGKVKAEVKEFVSDKVDELKEKVVTKDLFEAKLESVTEKLLDIKERINKGNGIKNKDETKN